ncbi:nucleotidyltransferase domain-containing protein [Mycobacterium simiae]
MQDGSRVSGTAGPNSDADFAVYFDGQPIPL